MVAATLRFEGVTLAWLLSPPDNRAHGDDGPRWERVLHAGADADGGRRRTSPRRRPIDPSHLGPALRPGPLRAHGRFAPSLRTPGPRPSRRHAQADARG